MAVGLLAANGQNHSTTRRSKISFERVSSSWRGGGADPYSMTSSSRASDGRHSTANLPGSRSAEPRADSRFTSQGKPFIPDDGQVALGGQHEYGRCDDDTETRDQFAYAGLGHGKVDCCEVMIHRASDQSTLPSSFMILHRRRQTQSVRRDWRGTESPGVGIRRRDRPRYRT